jgi:UPF0716 protein FxsA
VGKWLLLIFVILPIAEIWLLVAIGRQVGFWPMVGFVIGVGIVGSMLAKAEGARVLRDLARAREQGRVPEEGLLSAVLILVAGILLIIPGVITDVLGLMLLFPPTRRLVAGAARRWFEARVAQGVIHVHHAGGVDPMDAPIEGEDDVIDVEAEEAVRRDPPALPPREPGERK